jgi:hypothetical protein
MRCEILENGQQEHGRYDFPVFFQLISFIINLFQPLDHRQKSQLLCFQANPASFAKTPGVGGIILPFAKPTGTSWVPGKCRTMRKSPPGSRT